MDVISDFYEAWEFLGKHPMVQITHELRKSDPRWSSEMQEMMQDFDEVEKVEDSMMSRCLNIEVVKVNPATEEIDDDDVKNTAVRIWLEFGPWTNSEELPEHEREIFLDGVPSHDIDLDCGAPTFEEAIVELANLVLQKYGARCGECGQWRKEDDRVKAGMKCGPCAYGYSASAATYI